MTDEQLNKLLATAKPLRHPVVRNDEMIHVYSWHHELSYSEGGPTEDVVPGVIFDLIPGVFAGPRFPTGVLAGAPSGYENWPKQGDYSVSFDLEGQATDALLFAVARYRAMQTLSATVRQAIDETALSVGEQAVDIALSDQKQATGIGPVRIIADRVANAILTHLSAIVAERNELLEGVKPLARPAPWFPDGTEDAVYLGTQLRGMDNDVTPTVGECRRAAELVEKYK